MHHFMPAGGHRAPHRYRFGEQLFDLFRQALHEASLARLGEPCLFLGLGLAHASARPLRPFGWRKPREPPAATLRLGPRVD